MEQAMGPTDQERLAVVVALAEYFRSELSQVAQEAYVLALEDLGPDELRAAFKAAVKRSKFMPSGAELREYAKEYRYNQRLVDNAAASLRALAPVSEPCPPELIAETRREIRQLAESKDAWTLAKPKSAPITAEEKAEAIRKIEMDLAVRGAMG
jgi:hypothetical protein